MPVYEAKNKQIKKAWRPSHIHVWIEYFDTIVNTDTNAIICTDEELVFLTNELMKEDWKSDYTVAYRTFHDYKMRIKEGKVNAYEKEVYTKFLQIYKKALINQRKALFDNLQSDKKAWQRWAWIIERKFERWNLKKIVESDNKHEHKWQVEIVKVWKKNDSDSN